MKRPNKKRGPLRTGTPTNRRRRTSAPRITPSALKESRLVWKLIRDLIPSRENSDIYIDSKASIDDLVKSIRADGILEPLVVTADNFIVSGHRRHAAATRAELETVPCRVLDIKRTQVPKEKFTKMLREFNRQRAKSIADILREAAIDADPEAAYTALVRSRVAQASNGDGNFEIEGFKMRSDISDAKKPMLDAAVEAINSRRAFWPLTVRQVHYCLLSTPPLRHAKKPQSTYQNNRASYQDLCDLLTRARLSGRLPWKCIGDETRPVRAWKTFPNVGAFAQAELSALFNHYWRDLLQSQPDHVEIVVEKNSSLGVVQKVAANYTIPVTSGRGYVSKAPLLKLVERFRASAKRNLVLLLLSDFDPDGDNISMSTARSLRDDFSVPESHIQPVRVAIRPDQVSTFNLPKSMEAKRTSSGFNRFRDKHGVEYAVELEALTPEDLQAELDECIRAHIDVDLFNREVEQEKHEAAKLAALKRNAQAFIMEGLD